MTVTDNAATQPISGNGVVNTLATINGSIQLEIIVDRNTLEIFGNNGQLYMPLPVNDPVSNSLVSLSRSGGAATFNSLIVSKLKSIWPKA